MLKKIGVVIGGLAVILALCLLNQWLFSVFFGISYLGWYVKNGAIIGLVTTVASMSWGDLEKNSGMINPHPVEYLSSCMLQVGLPIYTLGTQWKISKDRRPRSVGFDQMLEVILNLVLTLAMVGWLVCIVPLQYFVYLLCGAPARSLAQSGFVPVARMDYDGLVVKEIKKGEAIPAGYWNASFDASKPLKITALYTTLFFFVLNLTGIKF